MTAASCAAIVFTLSACGGSTTPASSADDASTASGDSAANGADAISIDVPITPEKTPPADLTDDERRELGGRCNPIDPELYDAHTAARVKLEEILAANPTAENAEKNSLEPGLAKIGTKAMHGMSQADHDACIALWKKAALRKLFAHEPAEAAARDVVNTCVKRVYDTFGDSKMSFGGGDGSSDRPFCPEEFPIPANLSELPYESTAEDWDSPTWKCLNFGLRQQQSFQFEYRAEQDKGTFSCIARFLPRQGGAPVEVFRGGRLNADGELELQKKPAARRMKVK